MASHFDFLTVSWFLRAHVYVGNLGEFRYRFANDAKARTIEASAYTHWCFEKAQDVETQVFPWDEAGVTALRVWLDEQYVKRTSAQA